MAADLEYIANLDAKQILAELKKISAAIDKQAAEADKNFRKTGQSVDSVAFKIGVTSGVVGALTQQFINLGSKAVDAIEKVISSSTGLASDFETTEKIFTGIFEGNEEIAVAALDRIRESSKKLGADLTGLGKAFLPFVGSLDEFERLSKAAIALGRAQPEQGQAGAIVSLREALSGDITSLVKRFEIPREFANKIKKAFEEGGTTAFIEELDKTLSRLGISFDQTADTLQASMGRVEQQTASLQLALGTPIVEELKRQFDDLNTVLIENGDDLEVIADAFGRVLAYVVELVGTGLTDFLATLDTEQVTDIAEKFYDILEDARLLGEVLAGTEFPISFLDGLETAANKLDEALQTATKLSLLFEAGLAGEQAGQKKAEELGVTIFGRGITSKSPLASVLASEAELLQIVTAENEAYNAVIAKGFEAIEKSTAKKEENREATEKLKDAQKANTDAAESEADAFLKQRQAADEAAKQLEAYNEAQEKVSEAQEKLATDLQRELENIDIETERKRLDILVEGQRNREDAAVKNAQALEDIAKKNAQELEDASTELSRDEQDLSRRFANERLDLERDQAQQKVDIEKDTNRRIKDIRSEFAIDLEDAERRRDAVGYLRLLRQQNKQVQDAVTDRNRQVDDLRVTGDRRREELAIQQQRELEEAKLTNRRKLEDLQTSLDRQLEAQAVAYERELDTIATGEQRKLEDLATARERDIEDANKHYQQKLADLESSLKAELDIIKKYNAEIESEQARHNEAMQQAIKAVSKAGGPISQQPSTIQRRLSLDKQLEAIKDAQQRGGRTVRLGGRQAGGPVYPGSAYLVGEKGVELFQPSTAGAIVPNRNLIMSLPGTSSVVHNTSYNKGGATINLPDVAGLLGNPVAVAQIKNIVGSVLDDVL